jgi:hypothetical protein
LVVGSRGAGLDPRPHPRSPSSGPLQGTHAPSLRCGLAASHRASSAPLSESVISNSGEYDSFAQLNDDGSSLGF